MSWTLDIPWLAVSCCHSRSNDTASKTFAMKRSRPGIGSYLTVDARHCETLLSNVLVFLGNVLECWSWCQHTRQFASGIVINACCVMNNRLAGYILSPADEFLSDEDNDTDNDNDSSGDEVSSKESSDSKYRNISPTHLLGPFSWPLY